MFHIAGDHNWRHNLSGSPMLAVSVGMFFLAGLILAFVKKPDFPTGFFLLSWFGIMLMPAVFTSEGMPHALRTIGAIPPIYILSAMGFAWFYKSVRKINKHIAVIFLGVFLLQPFEVNLSKYFFEWAKNQEAKGAFRQDLVDLTNYLHQLPENIQKYIIVNEDGVAVPYPDGPTMPIQTVIFQSQSKKNPQEIKYLNGNIKIQDQLDEDTPSIVTLLKHDGSILKQLSQKWPQGQIKQINNFYSYEIK